MTYGLGFGIGRNRIDIRNPIVVGEFEIRPVPGIIHDVIRTLFGLQYDKVLGMVGKQQFDDHRPTGG
jgi:hypothetical protein